MLLRIVSIVFPIFIIVLVGYVYGRRHRPEMIAANRLNMEVFLPAPIFSVLAGKTFNLAVNAPIAIGGAVVVIGSGLLACSPAHLLTWPVARLLGYKPKTLVPPVMFNNVGNMGLPLLILTFGEQALGPAVMLMLVVTLLQFSLSTWILDGRLRLAMIWREPLFAAAASPSACANYPCGRH
jgi:predicted permease